MYGFRVKNAHSEHTKTEIKSIFTANKNKFDLKNCTFVRGEDKITLNNSADLTIHKCQGKFYFSTVFANNSINKDHTTHCNNNRHRDKAVFYFHR